jgi:hypothetical protein
MTFTHAVIVKEITNGQDRGWFVRSFAGSKELANKAMASNESRCFAPRNKGEFTGTKFQVVEVKSVA